MRADCPLCGGQVFASCLEQPRSAASQNGLFLSRDAALTAPVGPLSIRACTCCGFVFNAAFGAGVRYDVSYENDQTASPAFVAHVDKMADRVTSSFAGRGQRVVLEVGAGQGYFLERLVAIAGDRVRAAFGFDPAWRGSKPRPPISLRAAYFNATVAQELPPIDVAVSRHVIEHVDDPLAFLSAIAAALPAGALLFLETPCVQWILDGRVVQDFFFEHCSYFSAATLAFALSRAGFEVKAVDHVFDGQYLWAAAQLGPGAPLRPPLAADVERITTAATSFGQARDASVQRWRRELPMMPGKVAAWGAGAKGVTFVNTVDPEHAAIDCVIDINPKKQGAFVPVTGHPILSPEDAFARGVRSLVIMNPNYRAEVESRIANLGLGFESLTNA
jgi:hypothetical protein